MALSLDKPAGCSAHRRPLLAVPQHAVQRIGQRNGLAGGEQHTRAAVLDQLAMPAHIAGHQQSALSHRLQWLQWRDEFGQPHRMARIDHHVHQVVVAAHLGVRNPASEHNLVRHAQALSLRPERRILRSAADQQYTQLRLPLQQAGQRVQQQV